MVLYMLFAKSLEVFILFGRGEWGQNNFLMKSEIKKKKGKLETTAKIADSS